MGIFGNVWSYFLIIVTGGHAPGIWRVEVKDVAKHSAVPNCALSNPRIIQLQVSVVSRWRNSTLGNAGQ